MLTEMDQKLTLLSLLLIAAILFSSCAAGYVPEPTAPAATAFDTTTEYAPLTAIDYSVTAPDVRAVMTDSERGMYCDITDAVMARREEISCEASQTQLSYLLDIFRRSPYYFLLKKTRVDDGHISFVYAYTAEEQREMVRLMDTAFLEIANYEAKPEDNELDTILKIYFAVTHRVSYDTERQDNKQLSSPLFTYPHDEIYKAIRDGKSLCYGFAYLMCYALQQRGIDCFTVYGQSHATDMGHMWNVFCYDGAYFTCDPSWDRAEQGYAKLYHFGKTDAERAADTLAARDFAEYHEAAYGKVACTDDRFAIFRGILRFSYVNGHDFFFTDREGNDYIFNTVDFSMKQ